MQNGKTRRLTYTPANSTETQLIQKGLATYIPEDGVQQLFSGKHLIIGKGRRHEVFLITDLLWELFHNVKPQHPYFIGLFLGELKGHEFQPSLHILQRLADEVKPAVKAILTPSGEQQFLYGHSVEAQEFASEPHQQEETNTVIVVNTAGDGLGYGIVKKTPKRTLLKNLLDLGWYLRRGQ
ncbi:MAG: NIP7 N-terminal domain-related protein [Promethearchaeota archaeon]